jgi:hypothetical protein
MKAIQLELDFRSAIAHALAEPEVADLRMLWRSLEPRLLGLTQKEQLQVVGQALCDLAEVCQRRAELMWVDQHNTDGPIPDEDFLAGLVQKSMFLDISGSNQLYFLSQVNPSNSFPQCSSTFSNRRDPLLLAVLPYL